MSVCGTMHKVIYELQVRLTLFESIEITTSWKLHRTGSYVHVMGIRGNLFHFTYSSIKTGPLNMNCSKKKKLQKIYLYSRALEKSEMRSF